MSTLLSFSLVIVLVVFFHELGHFSIARLYGIRVKAFSVGIGPKLLSRVDNKGTEWKLCILPLGGYVEMLEGEKNKNIKESFDNKTVFQRLMVVLSGPLASVLLGWVLFFGVFNFHGIKEVPNFKTEGVGEVLKGSPADIAGMQFGDVISTMNHSNETVEINSFFDVYTVVQNAGKKPIAIDILRSGKKKTLTIIPRAVIDERTQKIIYRIGFKSKKLRVKKIGFVDSFYKANIMTMHSLTTIYDGLAEMFKNGMGDNVGGPVKIAQVSGQAWGAGVEYLLGFIAMLSINLAVINLLPLPIMDGGRAVLLIIEGVIRRPLPKKITDTIMLASVWFMLLFFVFVTLKDLELI